MMFSNKLRRWAGFAAVVALTTTASACSDDPTGDDHEEPEIAYARITVGSESVTILDGGAQTGTLTVPRGQSAVTVTYYNDADQVEDHIHADEFELRLVPRTGTTGITFTPNGVFGGTLNTTSAGQKSVDVELYHLEEGHPDFSTILTLTSQ